MKIQHSRTFDNYNNNRRFIITNSVNHKMIEDIVIDVYYYMES